MPPLVKDRSVLPLWLKAAYTVMASVVLLLYWREYGPANFLWFSDIALFVLALALWRESALLVSMMAVGTLFFELGWWVGFATGGKLLVTGYMFDPSIPLWLRGLSGFHFILPPLMLYLLWRLGYQPRALKYQTAVAWLVLPASYLWAGPEKNINWVYGPGMVQDMVPPLLWLAALMVALPLVIYWPTHFVLQKFFSKGRALTRSRDEAGNR